MDTTVLAVPRAFSESLPRGLLASNGAVELEHEAIRSADRPIAPQHGGASRGRVEPGIGGFGFQNSDCSVCCKRWLSCPDLAPVLSVTR